MVDNETDTKRTTRGRLDNIVNLRMSDEELSDLEAMRERLQADATPGHLVTRREVILAALDRMKGHYAKLDADRRRQR